MQNQKKKMVQKEVQKKYGKKLISQEEKKHWLGQKLREERSNQREREEESSNEEITKELLQEGARTASFFYPKGKVRANQKIHQIQHEGNKDQPKDPFKDSQENTRKEKRSEKGLEKTTYSQKRHGRKQVLKEEKPDKNRQIQRSKIKKSYGKRKIGESNIAGSILEAKLEKLQENLGKQIAENPMPLLFIIIFGLALLLILSTTSSCTVMSFGVEHISIVTSYTARDRHILQVEEEYRQREEELAERTREIEQEYPGYDEYRYELAEIGHNPYHLAALLTVLWEDYQPQEVREVLQEIRELQYEVTLEEVIEIRTRTEIVSGYHMTEQEDGTFEREYYEEEVEVEYEYRILKITLENDAIDGVVEKMGLSQEERQRYELLWETKGNKPYLFTNYDRALEGEEEEEYRIPAHALTNEDFRRMITLAEQFLGYAYVWGGSTPETGFDCSGFVSYVLNHCGNGWHVGRQNVRGLVAATTAVSREEAAPGDLIFFQNTGDIRGISHVGIYVGDGRMIHCGDPIRYVSIETTYWREHFYGFGRMP